MVVFLQEFELAVGGRGDSVCFACSVLGTAPANERALSYHFVLEHRESLDVAAWFALVRGRQFRHPSLNFAEDTLRNGFFDVITRPMKPLNVNRTPQSLNDEYFMRIPEQCNQTTAMEVEQMNGERVCNVESTTSGH